MRLVLAALIGALAPATGALALDAGERAFQKCYACHSVDPAEAAEPLTGPWLGGVVGRPAAALPDFSYSPAMQGAAARGLVWTAETLDAFLTDPHSFVQGTSMGFVRMRDPGERAAVIDYLRRHTP
jgi:cytochrome c